MLSGGPLITSQFIFTTAPFASCHASTIVETTSGAIVAAWFGGSHEGAKDVGIYLSRRVNGQWSDPVEVASAKGEPRGPFPCWNPVLFQPRRGPLLLFYKYGPQVEQWKGRMKESTDDGLTWTDAKPLPERIFGPIKNKPIQLDDGRILCGSSDELGGWEVHFEWYSPFDDTWERTDPINDSAQIGAIQPSLLPDGHGGIIAVGRTRESRMFFTRTDDDGKTWTPMKLLDVPNPNSGTDAVSLKAGGYALVYNDSVRSRTPLKLAFSTDGEHWTNVYTLESRHGEFSYPAIIQTKDGHLRITYTWKRTRIKYIEIDPAALTH